jgi:hypothetical protein
MHISAIMTRFMKKPTFNPELLNIEDGDKTFASEKVQWGDRAKIDKILNEQNVRLELPKVYYSFEDPELKSLIPTTVEFIDNLISEYKVQHIDEKQVIITIQPKDGSPFYVTVVNGKLKGDEQLLESYTQASSRIPNTQKYAHEQISDLIEQDGENDLSAYRLPKRIITDSDKSQAA